MTLFESCERPDHRFPAIEFLKSGLSYGFYMLYDQSKRRCSRMDISRKLGILVICAVPAIVGGGILYGLFHSYAPVIVYEIMLLATAGGIISK